MKNIFGLATIQPNHRLNGVNNVPSRPALPIKSFKSKSCNHNFFKLLIFQHGIYSNRSNFLTKLEESLIRAY